MTTMGNLSRNELGRHHNSQKIMSQVREIKVKVLRKANQQEIDRPKKQHRTGV